MRRVRRRGRGILAFPDGRRGGVRGRGRRRLESTWKGLGRCLLGRRRERGCEEGKENLGDRHSECFLGKRGGWGVEGGRVGGFGRWLNNGLEGNSFEKIGCEGFILFSISISASLPALAHARHKFLFYESYSYSRVASSDIRARTIIMCILRARIHVVLRS